MTLHELYSSIHQRWRSEDVASAILELRGDDLEPATRKRLQRAARSKWRWSSMSSTFAGADGLEQQIAVAGELFPDVACPLSTTDPDEVRAYIERLNAALHKGGRDFASHRLDRASRECEGMKMSHRAYNKRFRLILRMEDKLGRWTKSSTRCELAQIAKTRLAVRISWEDFSSDVDSACFIAWITSRLGLRSLFTWGKQTRAYDTNAEALYRRCERSAGAQWWAIAHVYPAPEVLARLSDTDKGRLLALWFSVMKTSAEILEEAVRTNDLDLRCLVVRRGNDSSTWNEAAGAFNKGRDGWINTLYALGMSDLLERFAPGKALRLMAADVVYMHKRFGSGGLEPDTAVWNDLPLPWDVVLGKSQCRRANITAACRRHGVDGGSKGWIAPRPKTVAEYTPTPELVHGVTIGSPHLASILRRCGYFSGPSKGVKAVTTVDIDRTMVDDTVVVTSAPNQPSHIRQ